MRFAQDRNTDGTIMATLNQCLSMAPKLSLKIIVLVKEFCCLWTPRRDQDTNDIRFGVCIPATRQGRPTPSADLSPMCWESSSTSHLHQQKCLWKILVLGTRTNQVPFATPFGTVTFLGLQWVSWPHPTSAKVQAVERVVWTTQVGVANAHLNSAPNVQFKEKIWSIWTKILGSSFSPLHFPRHLSIYVFIYQYIYI
jgi:hypothetical protein